MQEAGWLQVREMECWSTLLKIETNWFYNSKLKNKMSAR